MSVVINVTQYDTTLTSKRDPAAKHFYAFWAIIAHFVATFSVVYVQCK